MPKSPPRTLTPQLATLVDQPPAGIEYVYELKFDGYRALATLQRGKARIVTRNGLDWTAQFGGIAKALGALRGGNAVLDGEICYVMDDGRTDFQHLQNAMKDRGAAARGRLVYFVFDLLFLDGRDLRGLPLRERKEKLAGVLSAGAPHGREVAPPTSRPWAAPAGDAIRFSQDLAGDPRVLLSQACRLNLEGLIGKRPDRPYVAGRSRDWIKLKCQRRQEFVIVGTTAPQGSREGFGSLLLAVKDGDALRYVGRVGTGFSDSSLRQLTKQLRALRVKEPPVAKPPRRRDITWVEPKLVCEVSFTELTRDGSLRHPSFEGLREDKPVALVREEKPAAVGAAHGRDVAPPASRPRAAPAKASSPTIHGVRISSPDRLMDQVSGTTKLELARYHEAMLPLLLPYADQRPVALVRCPDGDAAACFFQKRTSRGMTRAVKHRAIAGNEVVYVTDARGWMELVQFNAVEFHGWGARLPQYGKPDWMVFDLDPDTGIAFARVVEAAREIRARLRKLKLESFVKTTGGKGLHVVVPLAAKQDWDDVKAFAEGFAGVMVADAPKDYVATMSKAKRAGKIFIDWLRNGLGATAVLPYSPRARPGCTVAMPVAWEELDEVQPKAFTVASVPGLVKQRRKDPWAGFLALKQALPALL